VTFFVPSRTETCFWGLSPNPHPTRCIKRTINEGAMDRNLDKLGIHQKNKKRIKDATARVNTLSQHPEDLPRKRTSGQNKFCLCMLCLCVLLNHTGTPPQIESFLPTTRNGKRLANPTPGACQPHNHTSNPKRLKEER
jgi:hypothetical protein